MNKKTAKKLLHEALNEPGTKLEPGKKKPNRTPLLVVIIICLVVFGLQYSTTLLSSDPITGPYGKITSPTAGSLTGKEVKVIGGTKNLEVGAYVWLVVDKPDIGLCWPKAPRIKPNSKFSTIIFEEGPKEPYTLSLYAVTKTINDQWQEWIEDGMFGGLPMPPDKRRLDSVVLILGG